MSARRWLRLLRSRWWILGCALAIGGLGGLAFARLQNRAIAPLFEARATVSFEVTEGGGGGGGRQSDTASAELEPAAVLAAEANADLLEPGRRVIITDERARQLVFSSRARDAREAEEAATAMRDNYFAAAAEKVITEATTRIEEIVVEAGAILARLDDLQPDEELQPLVDPALAAEVDFLDSQINSLTQRSSQLAVDKVLAELGDDRSGTPEEIDKELALIETRLDELYAEIAAITLGSEVTSRNAPAVRGSETESQSDRNRDAEFVPVAPDLLESTWTVDALEQRFAELQTEYGVMFSASQPVTPTEEPSPLAVNDLTPDSLPAPLSAGLGAGILLLLFVGGIALDDRVRRRVFVLSDFAPIPSRAEVPALVGVLRRSERSRSKLLQARTMTVRELRNSTLVWVEPTFGGPIVGLSGARVGQAEVEAVTLDLAGSLAAADRSVLIVNLVFQPMDGREADENTDPSVADLLTKMRADPSGGPLEVKQALANAMVLSPQVRMMSAGVLVDDPADVFVTTAFAGFIEGAREQFDVVLAVIPPMTEPATAAVRQAIDAVIAVCRLGKTRRSDLGLGKKKGDVGNLVGAVLLTRWNKRPVTLRRRAVERFRPRSKRRPSTPLEDLHDVNPDPDGDPEVPDSVPESRDPPDESEKAIAELVADPLIVGLKKFSDIHTENPEDENGALQNGDSESSSAPAPRLSKAERPRPSQ